MSTTAINKRQWQMIHRLAAELAQRRVDDNLVRTAAAYMKAYPDADLEVWLQQLNRLGDIFRSSNRTSDYRLELWGACRRLRPQPQSGKEWSLILGWAARLQKYYENNLRQAKEISDVSTVTLPGQPDIYRPPQPQPKSEPEPEIPVQASTEAEDMLSRMQQIWGSREDDNASS